MFLDGGTTLGPVFNATAEEQTDPCDGHFMEKK